MYEVTEEILPKVFLINNNYLDLILKVTKLISVSTTITHSIIDFYSVCLALKNGTAIIFSPFITKILWISSGIINSIHLYFLYQQITTLYGFWLAGASRLVLKLQQINDSIENLLKNKKQYNLINQTLKSNKNICT